MDAQTLLKEHINVRQLLEHYQFERITGQGYLRSCCKLHGGDAPTSFVINEDTGLWYCHTSCGGGDIYTMVQRMEEVTFEQSVKWVADFFGIDIENLEIKERKDSYLREMKAWIRTMTSRKKQEIPEYFIDVPVREVKKFRTFHEDTLSHFGVGFIESINLEKSSGEMYELRNRLSLPITLNNKQVGVSLRKTKASDYPKWSHQPRAIKTSDILYNYDATRGLPSITIVEGPLDVWAYHEIGIVAVATFGAHVTDEQYKMLMRTGADLVFSFDGDDAGRDATKKARDLFRYKANLECVIFDEGQDPESIEREQLKLNYEKRVKI